MATEGGRHANLAYHIDPAVLRRPSDYVEPMSLAPGQHIADRYIVGAVLGTGGFATVYALEHRVLGTRHALKVLPAHADPEGRQRLLAEGRIQARLSHPNVVRVTDTVDLPDGPALVLDFVDGETLRELLDRGPLDRARAVEIGDGILAGVAEAHRLGMIHRDLKPENVLIGANGTPRVADFGLARAMRDALGGPATKAGIGMGSPGYLAPEGFEDVASSDERADIYALGAILYELLAGQRAFPASKWQIHLGRALRGDFKPLDELAAGLPSRARAAIQAALSPRPEDRPASVQALQAAWRTIADPTASAQAEPAATAPESARAAATVRMDWLRSQDPPGGALASDLPAETNAFVGRDDELGALRAGIAASRLVTVLGPGGTGKTRLVTHFAWGEAAGWAGGVTFCDLSEARSADGLVRAVAATLKVNVSEGDPHALIGDALRRRARCLIVLDNVEQVVEQAARAVEGWLQQAPEVHLLVTSRERLQLAGERVLDLEPLDEDSAVALFDARAQAADSRFRVTDLNREQIRQIVTTLDGSPLAIELAAARIRVLSPSGLLSRLKDRFRVLTGGRRGHRQSTLLSTIDWSWDLLSPAERSACAQCSAFAGAFSMDAAEAVIDLSDCPDAPDVLDVLQALVDKSLVRRDRSADTDEPSLRMYASIQEYAAARLAREGAFPAAGPGFRAATWKRHGEHHVRCATSEEGGGFHLQSGAGPGGAQAALSNLMIACQRAVDEGETRLAVATMRAAMVELHDNGPRSLCVTLTEPVSRLTDLDPREQVIVSVLHGNAYLHVGRLAEARGPLEAGATKARALGDPRLEAWALGDCAQLLLLLSRVDEARIATERALALLESQPEPRLSGQLHFQRSFQLNYLGRLEECRACLNLCIELTREAKDLRMEARALAMSLHPELDIYSFADAEERARAAISLAREVRDLDIESDALFMLTSILLEQDRVEEARQTLERVNRIAHLFGAMKLAFIHHYQALFHWQTGELELAAAQLVTEQEVYRAIGFFWYEAGSVAQLGEVLLALGRAAEALEVMTRCCETARAVGLTPAIGRLLGLMGQAETRLGHLERASALLSEAEPILRPIGSRLQLVKWLCRRAEWCVAVGDGAAAQASVHEATQLAATFAVHERSLLGRMLHATRERVANAST